MFFKYYEKIELAIDKILEKSGKQIKTIFLHSNICDN